MGTRTVTLSAAAAAILVGAFAAQAFGAAETLSPNAYKNEQFNFKINTFANWTAFPPEPGEEKTTIVFFRTAKTGRGDVYEGTLFVFRLGVEGGVADLKEYMEKDRRYRGVNAAQREFVAKSKLPEGAVQYEFTFAGQGCTGVGLGVEYRREKDPIGAVYVCEQRLAQKYRNNFIVSLASFKFLDPKAPAEEDDPGSLASGKEVKLPIQVRFEALKKNAPPGWAVNWFGKDPKVKLPYYIFYSNCEQQDLWEVIGRLKALRPMYEKYFPPLEKSLVDRAAPIVRVCKDQEDFMTYSGNSSYGVLGYWASYRGELVVFRKSKLFGSMNDLFFNVLQHEGFHQYIYYACGEVDPHIIFHEGPAEFMGAFEPGADGKMVPSLKNAERIGTVKASANGGNYVPFKTIFYMTQGEYYQDADQCYAQGWAMTTFMMLGKQYMGSAFKEEWGKIPETYFRVLQGEVKKEWEKAGWKEKAPDKDKEKKGGDRSLSGIIGQERRNEITKMAMDEALKGIDFKEMEEAYKQFVKKYL